MQNNRGVTTAIVVHDDGTAIMPPKEEDQVGIVANLQPMITFSTDISKWRF